MPESYTSQVAKIIHELRSRVDRLDTYDLKGRVDSLEIGQAWADDLLWPLAHAQQAERLRRGQYARAARYVKARQDQSWQDRITTSPGAKRHMIKGIVADLIRGAMTMRDEARTAVERDKHQAEVARLSRLERTI
jgi:hypothetical protein